MSKINIFKAEDFLCGQHLRDHDAAYIANAKLQNLIDEASVVYGNPTTSTWNTSKKFYSTKEARLMFIEKLPVKECEHEPTVETCILRGDGLLKEFKMSSKCKHCGVELKVKWEAVK